jgi:anaerobic magnesium-protoporphyrin IX monomethyl ester cyclase
MRILFIASPHIVEYMGIGYLSAAAKKKGHKVFFEHLEDTISSVEKLKPDVVGFSLMTGQHRKFIDVARRVKEKYPHVITVFGGSHPTFFPDVPACVDYVVRGEADSSFIELLDDIEKGIKRERIVLASKLIQNIDDIPMPDRELIYKFPENANNPIRSIFTSRGCPFSCPYCYNGIYKELYKSQRIVRLHSIDRILAECEEVKNKFNAQFIFFDDDEFTMDGDRLQTFADRYIKEIGLPYHAQLRIDLIDHRKARILKRSGCVSITFAIECGNEIYRQRVLKRNISNQQIIDGSKLLHSYGINFRTENMIGLPYESFENALETVDLNIACKPMLGWVSLYQPYVGTPLGDMCVRDGLFSGSVDGIKDTFFEDSILPLPNKKKFINLQRLFGLVVNYPILKYLLPIVLNVPPNRFYSFLYVWWKKNRYDKHLYILKKKDEE